MAPTTGSTASALARVAHQLGATRMSRADVPATLSGLCAALVPAAGVPGVVLLLGEPADPRDPAGRSLFASDDVANRMGMIQQRAGRGPVPAAVRGDRALTVPDLTRSGPPELAAAAADCGLTRSLVVPVPGDGHPAGGLQLLTGADQEPDEHLTAALWPVVSMLAARLSDVRELGRLHLRVAQLTPVTPPSAADEPAPVVDEHADHGQEPADAVEETRGLAAVAAGEDPAEAQAVAEPVDDAGRYPATDLFAAGEPASDTPPIGQAELGWEGPPEPVEPPRRARQYPARVRVLGPVSRRRRSGPPPPSFAAPVAYDPAPVAAEPLAVEPLAAGPVAAEPSAAEAPVPTQRSGPEPGHETTVRVSLTPSRLSLPDAADDAPTSRVARHRLRDDNA